MAGIVGQPCEANVAFHLAQGDMSDRDIERKHNLSNSACKMYKHTIQYARMLGRLAFAEEISEQVWKQGISRQDNNVQASVDGGMLVPVERVIRLYSGAGGAGDALPEDPAQATKVLRKRLQDMCVQNLEDYPAIAIRAAEAALGHTKFEMEHVKAEDQMSQEELAQREAESMILVIMGKAPTDAS